MILKDRWHSLWKTLGTPAHPSLFEALITCYTQPHRHYHTLHHLEECLVHFDEVKSLALYPSEIELALWFHDARYEIARHDNEAQSAQFASTSLAESGLPESIAQRVTQFILATQHSAPPTEHDTQILVDIDLWILGAPSDRFDEYERQIRKEYASVADTLFRLKRTQFLETLLARPSIFNTVYFREHYEHPARLNLSRSIHRMAALL